MTVRGSDQSRRVARDEQVEDEEYSGEGVLAVTEAVLQVAPMLLVDVEGLVLDLPSSSGPFGEFVAVHVEAGVGVTAVGGGVSQAF